MRIVRNPTLDDRLVAGLVDVWVVVTNAGGAVGFVAPVTTDDVRPTALEAFARVLEGIDDLVVAFEGADPVGMGFLETNEAWLHGHWGTVRRLQRAPSARGRGVGAAMLGELERAAADRGLQRTVLTVRGGTGREALYEALGYAVEATLPGRIRLAEQSFVDEVLLSKDLTGHGGQVLRVRRLDADLPMPAYAHPGDAGLDLHAARDVTLEPGERAVIPTGVAIALPAGCVGLVHPRSGLAARSGLALVNAPGTVDEGYRGEIKVIAVNLDPAEPVKLSRGDRIAQLVVQRVERVTVTEVADLGETARGQGGFGSSGA